MSHTDDPAHAKRLGEVDAAHERGARTGELRHMIEETEQQERFGGTDIEIGDEVNTPAGDGEVFNLTVDGSIVIQFEEGGMRWFDPENVEVLG
jgi:hypothetical protein